MITLRKVDGGNIDQLLSLEVDAHQRAFVASNTRSILDAYVAITAGGVALPFGIYDGDTPVGFLMIGYGDADWPDAPAIAHDNYSLWRLMIDRRYQNRGYGRAAMQEALRFIRTFPCGPAQSVWLSYEPENAVARQLYHAFGFEETGEMDGNEVIAALKL